MLQPLSMLKPGTRFRLQDGRTGTLLMINKCRALVRVDGGVRDVAFVDGNGETRAFQGRYAKTTSWTPTLKVEPIGFTPLEEENDMATATKSKKAKKKSTAEMLRLAKAEAPKAPRERKAKTPRAKPDGKMSLLDAAVKILGEAGEAMNCQEIVAKAGEKGYWTSPAGKTPHATLYSAMLMEIRKKGSDARFLKTDRGRFGLAK